VASRLTIQVPRDYLLRRDFCSYGYFLLEPNHWDVGREEFSRVLELAEGPAKLVVAQPRAGGRRRPGEPLAALADRGLSRRERAEAVRLLTRMLRLDEGLDVIRDFHRVDPRWKRSGRGRLMRSPGFFEDVIKTVTSCNVTWPSTVAMNRRVCEVLGRGGSFPSARKIARTRPAMLRARCRVGYRDQRIVDLAGMFASGEIEPEWFEDPATTDEAIWDALLEWPGIGPYAAANIMQLLGRYHRLPLDTESIRHGKMVLGMTGSDRAIMAAMHRHFAPFGAHAFRSYWFELWEFYESRRGKSWLWEKETVGATFTAAQLKAEPGSAGSPEGITPQRASPRG
jgi:3-methyladenine DNA glycosylase/8-oxoguanine DNA glycosylase